MPNELDKKDEKGVFDAGEMSTLKKELNLEKLRKGAFIDDQFRKHITGIIKNMVKNSKKKQRFAVNWGANAVDADGNQKMEVWVGATSETATKEDIDEFKAVYGCDPIVPMDGLSGVVHEK